MALKINKLIGTNRGITSEGYVRIEKYNINKHVGTLMINVGLYQNQQIAESASLNSYPSPFVIFSSDTPNGTYLSQNVDVKSTYIFPLSSSVEVSGSFVDIIDLSPLESGSVFQFAYPKLKEELELVFGSGTIQDII
jgi:hypothetical protein